MKKFLLKENIKFALKILLGLSWVLVIIFYIGYLLFSDYQENKEGNKINPAIYPAFREIEIKAFKCVRAKAKDSEEYAKCKRLADKTTQGYFSNPEFKPSAKEWYNFLGSLGYSLPIYKLGRQPTEEEYNRAMEKQEKLKEILIEYILNYKLQRQ